MPVSRARGWLILALIALPGPAALAASPRDALLDGFEHPPAEARPQVWWHWMSGNVDLAGAKLDLAWMQRIGIGGVHTFTGGGLGEPHVIDPPVDFLSETWRATFRETTRLARASGMEVTIAGSPGWSETGGIWVAPENAMKKYVWSETQLRGGGPVDLVLAQPPAVAGPFLGVRRTFNPPPQELKGDVYRDSVLIAFPTPAAELLEVAPAFFANGAPLDLSPLRAADLSTSVRLPIPEGQSSAAIDAVFERPTTIAALTLGLAKVADVEIQAGNDAAELRTLLKAAADPSEMPAPQQTYSFAATRAKVFRIVLTRPAPKPLFPDLPPRLAKRPAPPSDFLLTRLDLTGGARVSRFESKAGFQSTIDGRAQATAAADRDAVIPLDGVVDLSDKLDAQGRLRWNAPAGRWTLLRFGWSLTGQTNGPAQAKDTGLEVDKLDPRLVREYLEHYLSIYSEAMQAPLGDGSVQNLLTDSWEAGVQNWTPTLLTQFKARRGYDPLRYLPVLAGRVVADPATSERFLWDFHRTLEEALADNHYGVIAQVLHEHGMRYYTEAQGDTPRAIGDGFAIKSRADVPTGEFWYRAFATAPGQPTLQADLREAASAAHVYGKPLAAAESLTVAAGTDPWAFSPAMLKPVIDEIFAGGINRILLHESHHQPLLHAAPGLMLGFFGQFFNRNDTWAEDAGPWVDYLSRTSYLLQRGRFVADVLCFYGEERNLTEINQDRFESGVPEGFGYDYINAEALSALTVQDGSVLAPSGLRYRIVYVPPQVTRYSLPTLRKLRELVAGGAVLVAARPAGGLGVLSPDAEVSALADEIWGPNPAASGAHRFAQGRVYASTDLRAALDAEGIVDDVMVEPCVPACRIRAVHRRTDEADIYFLSNQDAAPRTTRVRFRVKNRVPELWRADTGTTEPLSFQSTAQGITVPLSFAAHDAFFVVLRDAPPHSRDVPSHPRVVRPPPRMREILRVEGPWKVRFQSGRGAPQSAAFRQLIDWRTSPDEGIRYFSGAATYHTSLRLPSFPTSRRQRLRLDLGSVHELAVVFLDGAPVGTAWHAPFEIDLPPGVKPGRHELTIRVDNLWVNRLIGDEQPGATRVAFAPQSPYTATSPLLPSGLLGPVRILATTGEPPN
jgi:hypothetical protein